MLVTGIIWLVAFGMLLFTGWPLLFDEDEDADEPYHCGCLPAGLCDECLRELGGES